MRIYQIFLIILVFALSSSAQAKMKHPDWFKPGEQTIKMYRPHDKKQVQFATKQAKVTLGYDQCLKYLQNKISRNPKSKPDKKLLVKIIAKGAHSDMIDLGTYLHDRDKKTYLVADLLQKGNGQVKSTDSQNPVKTIKVEMYAKKYRGGRHFYLPNGQKFLTVVDWTL